MSLPVVLAERARQNPRAIAFTVVKASAGKLVQHSFSYRRVERMIRRAAADLEATGVAEGDCVILSLGRPEQFFAYFMACQGLGAVPVPLPSASEYQVPAAFVARIRAVATDCHPRVVVVDSAAGWRSVASGVARGVRVIDATAINLDDGAATDVDGLNWDRPLHSTAFVQYTSGSTGDPKGVVVDQGNLLANFRAIAEGGGFTAKDRSFSWLPLFHDMGLIGGFLLGIYMGIPTFVMATRYFVLRPDAWLRAMSELRATFTVAPNFAYSLAARRLPERALRNLDLSDWRLAFDGAEPIDRETIEAFIERFSPYGFHLRSFYPVYGLAECTLAVAFPTPGSGVVYDIVSRSGIASGHAEECARSSHDAVSVVSVGQAVPGHHIEIQSADGAALADRCIGEVVVSGPSVTRGYYGRKARSAPEVRTGDLGYFAEGNLFIVDRIKDLVIIGGRNFVPADIERKVSKVDGITLGSVVAFGIRSSAGTEELCMVAAMDPKCWRRVDEIKAEMKAVVAAHFGVPLSRAVLVAPGSVPKTSSGKVQRSVCQQMFRDGRLRRAESVGSRVRMKAAYVQRRVSGALAANRRASDFPPAAADSVPPPRRAQR